MSGIEDERQKYYFPAEGGIINLPILSEWVFPFEHAPGAEQDCRVILGVLGDSWQFVRIRIHRISEFSE
jgi:hypothetical protein